MTKIKILSNKYYVIVAILVVALLIGGGIVYANRSKKTTENAQNTTSQPAVNYDPPTAEDSERVDDNKQKIVDRENDLKNQPSKSPNGRQTIKPVITYAGQYGNVIEVGAYAPVFEEGGTCTATFVQGSKTVTKSVQAVRSASSTDCPVMSVDSSQFSPKGTYSVTVKYTSSAYNGTSDARNIEVK